LFACALAAADEDESTGVGQQRTEALPIDHPEAIAALWRQRPHPTVKQRTRSHRESDGKPLAVGGWVSLEDQAARSRCARPSLDEQSSSETAHHQLATTSPMARPNPRMVSNQKPATSQGLPLFPVTLGCGTPGGDLVASADRSAAPWDLPTRTGRGASLASAGLTPMAGRRKSGFAPNPG
jgi:hypothetical protein